MAGSLVEVIGTSQFLTASVSLQTPFKAIVLSISDQSSLTPEKIKQAGMVAINFRADKKLISSTDDYRVWLQVLAVADVLLIDNSSPMTNFDLLTLIGMAMSKSLPIIIYGQLTFLKTFPYPKLYFISAEIGFETFTNSCRNFEYLADSTAKLNRALKPYRIN